MSSSAKVWLITGSNSGFGLALTKAVLAKGDRAIATSRHPEELDDLVKEYPDTVKVVELDVTKSEDIAKAVNTALETDGGIDVLVNNAGFGTLGAVEEIAEDKIRFLMQSLRTRMRPSRLTICEAVPIRASDIPLGTICGSALRAAGKPPRPRCIATNLKSTISVR